MGQYFMTLNIISPSAKSATFFQLKAILPQKTASHYVAMPVQYTWKPQQRNTQMQFLILSI